MREMILLEEKTQGQSPQPQTGSMTAGTVPSADPVLARTVPSVQRLLDVISSILAEEYIMIAKQNPETFQNHGGSK